MKSGRVITGIALGLMLIHVLLLLGNLRVNFATRNEVAHVPAGLAHWERGAFGLYGVNPPLWRMIAVLPVFLGQPDTQGLVLPKAPGDRPEMQTAQVFAERNARNYFDLICLARLAGLAWSLLGGWIIYRWAGELYGQRAGLVGLILWCFNPNVLAHAPLVTPDMPATVSGLAATYLFWRYLRRGSWRLAYLAGFMLGVAQLTKFTLLVLYGAWFVVALIQRLNRGNRAFRSVPLWERLAQGLLIVFLSLLVINIGYGFDRSFLQVKDYQFVSPSLKEPSSAPLPPAGPARSGNRFRESWIGALVVPLPADYVAGIDLQRADFEAKLPSYLAGQWRRQGWWYYYLYALAVKVPLGAGLFGLWALGLVLVGRRGRAELADELTLWIPALSILILVSSQTGFSHHMRYVLPLFPFVIISTSKLAAFVHSGRWWTGALVIGLLCWSVASSLTVYPHSLSYFNELAGGPDNGHKHLVDSNIDWGQDLLFFIAWVDRHPEARPIALAYSNAVDYRILGVEYPLPPRDPPDASGPAIDATEPFGPQPGYFALDVHNLTKGPYRYFDFFQPVAKAGYSIFIYHLTTEEANRVRRQLGLPALPDGERDGDNGESERNNQARRRVHGIAILRFSRTECGR